VEGYLSAADKIQPMIAIEVKFVETARDPSREFGVDWSGTFGNSNTRRFKSADENGLIEYEDRPSTGFGPELAGFPNLLTSMTSAAASCIPNTAS
jgi:type II secretory pathway component GspD/PulD (secretin)